MEPAIPLLLMTTTVAVLASTTKGGSGAHVETVASTENQAVGRDLGEFYRQFDPSISNICHGQSTINRGHVIFCTLSYGEKLTCAGERVFLSP